MVSCCKDKEDGRKWKNISWSKNSPGKESNCALEPGTLEDPTDVIEPPDGGCRVN